MARIYKKTIYRPLPDDAVVVKRNGKQYAVRQNEDGGETQLECIETKNGIRTMQENPYYTARFTDATGRLCERSTQCKERRSAEHKLNQWLQDIEKVKAGILTQDEYTVGKRQRFQLEKHLGFFQEHLQSKGATARYVRETVSRILRVCSECKFHCLADMNAAVLMRWLNRQGAAGMGARTRNGYREVMLTLCNWAVGDNSLPYNPFCKVPKAKETIDRRHERRALTCKEIKKLLTAAQQRPLDDILAFFHQTKKHSAMDEPSEESKEKARQTGRERKLIYAALIYTGLRKSELASITVGQVFLETKIPHIALAAKDEKNRRGSKLPLHPQLAELLRNWLIEKRTPKEKLFQVPAALHKILDRDLKYAGINKRDSLNRVIDVHALRHTHATLLAQSGVSPSIAKSAMRHSDIRLTMNVYSHLELNDIANAVNQLPDLLDEEK